MAQRKRKIRMDRIIIIATVILAIIIGTVIGIQKYQAYVIMKQREEYEAEINAVSKPDFISQKTFDTIKNMTLDTDGEIYADFFKHIDQYPQDVLDFLLQDFDRYAFIKEFPNADKHQSPKDTLNISLKQIPHLLQWDLDYGYTPYGESYFYVTGCAPTCLSMVLSYLKQDPTITPRKLADYSLEQGFYVDGAGTSWDLLDQAAHAYGINVQQIPVSQENIENALKNNQVLIASMHIGDFTQVGHFIVIRGIEDGKVLVNDPNSKKRSKKKWDYDVILPQIRNLWAYSV